MIGKSAPESPTATPVKIVNLPPEAVKRLPRVRRYIPRRADAAQKKSSKADDVRLPGAAPRTDKPRNDSKGSPGSNDAGKGLLPFLTQRDIDDFAKKGMPEKGPGDDSVTLDTDEFKFIAYNRWLKIKVESRLRYPELAAISGIQGVLYLKFDIMKDGSLGNLELLKSSGYKILDDEALKSIRDSAPFQPLPEEWGMERYPIRAAVVFYLSEAYLR